MSAHLEIAQPEGAMQGNICQAQCWKQYARAAADVPCALRIAVHGIEHRRATGGPVLQAQQVLVCVATPVCIQHLPGVLCSWPSCSAESYGLIGDTNPKTMLTVAAGQTMALLQVPAHL